MRQTLLDIVTERHGNLDKVIDVALVNEMSLEDELPDTIIIADSFSYFIDKNKRVETKKIQSVQRIFTNFFSNQFN